MKVLIINSSPRKNGATARILSDIETVLHEGPCMETELVHLADQMCAATLADEGDSH